MTRYQVFEKIEELTKMSKMIDHYGYQKMIQTGNLNIWDYGRGFIDFNIFYFKNNEGKAVVRLWFSSIDDGDYGGSKYLDSLEKAKELVDKVANEVFKDMVSFPNEEELNKTLQKYGLYVCHE